jgi:aspartate carbamoyltransferase catalytic subunit
MVVTRLLVRRETRTRVYSNAGSITCFHNPSTTTRWTFSSWIARLCKLVLPETEDAILFKPGVVAAAVCRVAPTV